MTWINPNPYYENPDPSPFSPLNPQPESEVPANPPSTTLPVQTTSPLLVVKQRDVFAEVNQQRFHNETLQWYGEECIVRLIWRAEDAAAGLVTYCQECQDSPNPTDPDTSIQSRVSKVYRQTGNSYCPTCYGTTFTGGFQPVVYHVYMLASDTTDNRQNLTTGQFWKQNPSVQFSWFPQIRTGDLVARVEGWNRNTPTSISEIFQVSTVAPQTIRTGPGPSATYPNRVGPQIFPGSASSLPNNTKIISQTATLENLWPSHPYYSVPLV